MEYATLIVLLALLQYVFFTIRVGASRGKYHVNAPACEVPCQCASLRR
jgi:hypothetical protein